MATHQQTHDFSDELSNGPSAKFCAKRSRKKHWKRARRMPDSESDDNDKDIHFGHNVMLVRKLTSVMNS